MHRHADPERKRDQDVDPVPAARQPLARPRASDPRAGAGPGGTASTGPAVQMFATAVNAGVQDVHAAAAHGIAGPASTLPHLDAIQRSFGHHDVSGVRAHVGGDAAQASAAMGARAYATGDSVAFADTPDLHLAAHEAAHVVQQRGGVRLAGGVGRAGDPYEQHADAVADRVVRGESAQGLLDQMAHRGSAGGPAVQRDEGPGAMATPLDVPVHLEGTIRFPALNVLPESMTVLPYTRLTGIKLTGSAHYQGGPRERREEAHPAHPHRTATAPPHAAGAHTEHEPAVEAHLGPSTEVGGHHGVGIEAEISHHLRELAAGAAVEVSGGAELTDDEGAVGIGISAGSMRFGRLVAPLPSARLDLVAWEADHRPRFLVAQLRVPVSPSFAFSIPVGDSVVEIVPDFAVVLQLEPDWFQISRTLGQFGAATTAEDAAAVGVGEAAPVAELAGTIAAPVVAEGAMLAIFAHDVGRVEDLDAAARSGARTLFNYCMSYTTYWFNQGGIVTGTGADEGTQAARREVAAFESANPGVTSLQHAQRRGARAIYMAVYEQMRPQAESALLARTGARDGGAPPDLSHDDLGIIPDHLDQVRWRGPLFQQFGGHR